MVTEKKVNTGESFKEVAVHLTVAKLELAVQEVLTPTLGPSPILGKGEPSLWVAFWAQSAQKATRLVYSPLS